MKKIVICTLRDNKGATGGPGGVVYMISTILGREYDNFEIEYRFNKFRFGRCFRPFLNKGYFFFKCLFERDVFYISHDIDSGSILARLNKEYSLVYHNQGPIVQELLNFGLQLSEGKRKQLANREKTAFIKAKTLHFPSQGAAEMYFNNSYASCLKREVNIGFPLYNTIPIEKGEPIQGLSPDKSKLTFFSLGTLTDAKGQDLSIRFLKYYMNENPNENVRYIVVGKGPLEEELKEKAKELACKYPNFEYIYYPSLRHSEVMFVHEIADVYIMLHRISIFDFATLEAMSSHTAIVLSPIGGNLDFNKADNIIYVNENDEATAIKRINKEACTLLKELNYSVYREFFSEESFKKEYQELISNNTRVH